MACHWATGELSSNQGGFTSVALFKDFEQVKALLIVEAMGAPIIQDQQVDASELVDQTREAAVEGSAVEAVFPLHPGGQ